MGGATGAVVTFVTGQRELVESDEAEDDEEEEEDVACFDSFWSSSSAGNLDSPIFVTPLPAGPSAALVEAETIAGG